MDDEQRKVDALSIVENVTDIELMPTILDVQSRYDAILRKEYGNRYGSRSMSPSGIAEVIKVVDGVGVIPAKILEIGTGFSTVVLNTLCSDHIIVSLDHDLEWLHLMADKVLPAFDLSIPSPSMMLIPRIYSSLGLYHVIIVDHGPELQTRADDLPWIVKCMAPGGVMIFDDWRPKHEGRIRRGLAKIGKFDIKVLDHTKRWDTDKAIAVASWNKA